MEIGAGRGGAGARGADRNPALSLPARPSAVGSSRGDGGKPCLLRGRYGRRRVEYIRSVPVQFLAAAAAQGATLGAGVDCTP